MIDYTSPGIIWHLTIYKQNIITYQVSIIYQYSSCDGIAPDNTKVLEDYIKIIDRQCGYIITGRYFDTIGCIRNDIYIFINHHASR